MKKVVFYSAVLVLIVNIMVLYFYFEANFNKSKSVSLLDLERLIWVDLLLVVMMFILYKKVISN